MWGSGLGGDGSLLMREGCVRQFKYLQYSSIDSYERTGDQSIFLQLSIDERMWGSGLGGDGSLLMSEVGRIIWMLDTLGTPGKILI